MLFEDGQQISDPCPGCNSTATRFDSVFGYWQCQECPTVWAYDKDDPDYDQLTDDTTTPTTQGDLDAN